MECNKDEAIRAMKIAENKMTNNDFEGARKIALMAKKLFPEIGNISQLLAVCEVHCSAQKKINGAQMDLYGILQLESLADEVIIKKQYRKLALVLHPDKNKFPGAEAAFKLIGEANMILSDKAKRYLHDFKCREPAKPMGPNPQNCQGNQNAHGQFGDQSNGVNDQQQAKSSNGRQLFWTFCPFCNISYEYYREFVNKHLRCLKCAKYFIACEFGAQQSGKPPQSGNAGTQSADLGSKMGQPASFHQEELRSKRDAEVDGQTDDNVCVSLNIGTDEKGNIRTEGQEERVAFKGRGRNASVASDSNGGRVECHRRSHKRPEVSCSEEAVDDFSPKKRSKLMNLSSDVEDKQKEQVPCDRDKVLNTAENSAAAESKKDKNEPKTSGLESNGDVDILNGNSRSSSDSEDDLESVYINCQDVEFSNFDKDKEEQCFQVDQIWACYDTTGMPRYYTRIRKVYSRGFRLQITWLEANPENLLEIVWAEEGLPVACGKFVLGDTEQTSDRLMFSHQIAYKKGSSRSSYIIYPKKGEIWALFKDWDINWISDPQKHMKYKYDIVEVLSDFDNSNGVLVAYMVKMEGFVSLFQNSSQAGLAEQRIPSDELFRFSHRIPSVKLTGMERADVPIGSFELDTASLPDDFDEYHKINKVDVKPESDSAQVSTCRQSTEAKVKPSSDFLSIPKKLVKSEGDNGVEQELKEGNTEQSNSVEGKFDNSAQSNDNYPSIRDGDVITSSNGFTKISESSSPSRGEKEKLTIHDFNVDKQNWNFQVGQVWALQRNHNRNMQCYAQIKKIEASPPRLHVDILESCTSLYKDVNWSVPCGLFKTSTGLRQIVLPDSFLYLVKAEVNGKNRFNIYPRVQEIWILHNKQDRESSFSDLDAGECDVVEVLENKGHVLKVLPLLRVPGYKSVFRAVEMHNMKGRVLDIQLDELERFLCRVPAFLFMEENYGSLRGSWELDLAEFSGLLSN